MIALTELTTHKSDGLKQRKPCSSTIVTALDMIKAFNTVFNYILLSDIQNSNYVESIKIFLTSYINGRKEFGEFKNVISVP